MRVRLTHVTVKASGTRALRQSVLDVDAVRIGRGTDNHISIRGLSVPLHHSVLVRRGEQITIDRVDAGTIEVDGREGSGRALRPGNVVRIGDLEIRVVEPGDGEDLAIEVEQVERSVTELDALAKRTHMGVERGLFTRRRLSIAGGLATLGVLLGLPLVSRMIGTRSAQPLKLVRAVEALWVSDPVSGFHWDIARTCIACHAVPFAPVRDQECQACHESTEHHDNARSAPRCATCHPEHRGSVELVAVAETECVRCHAALASATDGPPVLVAADGHRITSFAADHPEFAVYVAGGTRTRLNATPAPTESGHLKFNHARHLAPGLRGPEGIATVQLGCGDCHQGPMAGASGSLHEWTWKRGDGAGDAQREWPTTMSPDAAPAEEPAYFMPVRYDAHCSGCHPNATDPEIGIVPHATPEVIRAFLRGAYTERAIARGEAERDSSRRAAGSTGIRPNAPSDAGSWVNARVRAAEEELFTKPGRRCQRCHALSQSDATPLPTVLPTAMPVRWFPWSRFDHAAHRLLCDPTDQPPEAAASDRCRRSPESCTHCHADARASLCRGSDSLSCPERLLPSRILLPTIETCRVCHHPQGARDQCAECHTYHAARGS